MRAAPKLAFALLVTVFVTGRAESRPVHAAPRRVELLCHRTANEDVPENTLESLRQAALLGCDVVEVDVRRTLDGKIVLNHDGVLERLTDGIGEVEQSYYDDLRLRDAGAWMGERFMGMRIPLFEDALRVAHDNGIRLILDLKDKNLGADILPILRREGMLQRVRFGGEWADVKRLNPRANQETEVWLQPGVTADQVRTNHRRGKTVIVNFSGNHHEMDLSGMKAAVTDGADGINVDYPRLGADAVGRPVEKRLSVLAAQADAGETSTRVRAILELARYRGFPLQSEFAHWLLDPDDHVSRAAAIALVLARPQTSVSVFAEALSAPNADARANASWALGRLGAPASVLVPLLQDQNSAVLREALAALANMPGNVDAGLLLPLLSSSDPLVRGTAAVALAKHQPQIAATAVPARLRSDMKEMTGMYDVWVQRGEPTLTSAEIAKIMGCYRGQMKLVQAIAVLDGEAATNELEQQAFRPGEDFARMNGVVAAFRLWDRVAAMDHPAIEALGAQDTGVADKAEWMLIHGGPSVLPDVRTALASPNTGIRERAIRIVAWQGDREAVAKLKEMRGADPKEDELAAWAIEKIELLHPNL